MTLKLDDETTSILNQLVEQEHIGPAQLVKNVLLDYVEDCQDATQAERAYQHYLNSSKVSHRA
jgi:predicted transcriptional regulator